MGKYGSLCLLTVFLIGCATGTPWLPGPTAHSVVKPGSILKLNKPLTVSPRSAGVRIQNGKIAENKFDQWRPNCRIRVRDPASTNQIIQPDEFTITQIGIEFQYVQSQEIKLAAGISFAGGVGSATAEVMRTNFFLESKTQPHVMRLSCQHWENPSDSRHLMLSEIEETLGEYFTFQLKPNS